jgi:hypothetical protein
VTGISVLAVLNCWVLPSEILLFDLRRCLDYMALEGSIIDEWWIGKDLEGSGRGLSR